jgi:hypothetical protein
MGGFSILVLFSESLVTASTNSVPIDVNQIDLGAQSDRAEIVPKFCVNNLGCSSENYESDHTTSFLGGGI